MRMLLAVLWLLMDISRLQGHCRHVMKATTCICWCLVGIVEVFLIPGLFLQL
jgi:hypothetical protein